MKLARGQTPYYDIFSELQNVYLEESFLLELTRDNSSITMLIEAVLLEKHPLYSPPKSGQKFCLCDIRVTAYGVSDVQWPHKMVPIGLEERPDYGNIDMFYKEEGVYHIEVDGEVLKFRAEKMVVVCLGKIGSRTQGSS